MVDSFIMTTQQLRRFPPWSAIADYMSHRYQAIEARVDDGAAQERADIEGWLAILTSMQITTTFDERMRDDQEPCVVPRSLLRRVVADLELVRGFIRGFAANSPDPVLQTEMADGLTLEQRLAGTDKLVDAVMAAGRITEDEDLDD